MWLTQNAKIPPSPLILLGITYSIVWGVAVQGTQSRSQLQARYDPK